MFARKFEYSDLEKIKAQESKIERVIYFKRSYEYFKFKELCFQYSCR